MRFYPRLGTIVVLQLLAITAASQQVAIRHRAVTPSADIQYTTFNEDILTLVPHAGRNIALLTPDGPQYKSDTIAVLVDGLDRAYDYYASATEQVPYLYRQFHGKDSIAVVQTTCGAGCGYLGATGVEIAQPYFDILYRGVAERNEWDQVLFYELGRNFWFYGDQIEYQKNDPPGTVTGSVTTGFAVLNRFLSMEAAGLSGAPFNGQPFSVFRSRVEELVDLVVADPALNWSNTLRIGVAPNNPMNLGATDLFASHILRLRRVHGEEFMSRLWRSIAVLQKAPTTQQALDNFVVAASRAANQNLVDVFKVLWRWPVSDAASVQLQNELGSPTSTGPYR